MEHTRLPNLNHEVSRIGLGTWAIGGWQWGGTDEKDAIDTLLNAFDLGINLIDTAPVYGFGLSEEIVGKAIKHYGKRDKLVIATKVGLNWDNGKLFRDCRKERILQEIKDSLRRLQVSYIDIYQVHWPDPLVPFQETAEVMASLLKEGLIRSIGVSNYSNEQMDAFQKGGPLHVMQPPYNLFERAAENSVLSHGLRKNIASLAYGPLCRGLLSGRMKKNVKFKGDDLRKVDPKFQEPNFSHYLECVSLLDKWVEAKYKRSVLALAIRWVLDKGVNGALWGARKPEQLTGLDSVWGWSLKPEDFIEIDQILDFTIPHPIGPEFMAPPARSTP